MSNLPGQAQENKIANARLIDIRQDLDQSWSVCWTKPLFENINEEFVEEID